MINRPVKKHFHSFFRKEDGNFTMFAALLLPVCFAAGSLAIDFSNAVSMKTRLQNAADGAALATASQLAAKKITVLQAKSYAENFFNGLIANEVANNASFSATPVATITPIGSGTSLAWTVKVTTTGSQNLTPMAKFIGQNKMDVKVSATSSSSLETNNPLSMVLVLDRSGSMDEFADGTSKPWYCSYSAWSGLSACLKETKMDALKTAVTNMVVKFTAMDPTNIFVRLGTVAYNDKIASNHKLDLSWLKPAVTTLTATLTATGGTDSSEAMEWARGKLKSPTEKNEHKSKNGNNDPAKFIVFMTDGDNNETKADTATKKTCDDAKKEGVVIFTVAFQAPTGGKALLQYCASGTANYYNASSAADLLKAFENIGEKASDLSVRLSS